MWIIQRWRQRGRTSIGDLEKIGAEIKGLHDALQSVLKKGCLIGYQDLQVFSGEWAKLLLIELLFCRSLFVNIR